MTSNEEEKELSRANTGPTRYSPTEVDLTGPEDSSLSTRSLPFAFGKFELLDVLGHGGMGIVYKAREDSTDRQVALKMIHSSRWGSPEILERFQNEFRLVANLQHPHIVVLHEVGEVDGQWYFTMELLEGGSLHDATRERPLEPRNAARIIQKVAEAVHFAHQRGIVHRDIKPHNILLTIPVSDRAPTVQGSVETTAESSMSNVPMPRLTDFGLARTEETTAGHSITGRAMGTPSYMPPEQAKGQWKQIDATSDVYSLGATLYCLLTGRPPFQASSNLETLRQVQENEPAPPHNLNQAVSRDLETICLKCLRKEQTKRYTSALELAEDLSRFLRGEPVQARPVNWWERSWRWCRRNPVITALWTALTLLLLIGSLVSAHFALEASREADEARDQRDKANRSALSEKRIRAELVKQLYRANILAYSLRLKGAEPLIERAQFDKANRSLSLCDHDVRGWEYQHLMRRCQKAIFQREVHSAPVLCSAVSARGWMVTGGEDRQLVFWGLASGNALEKVKHPGIVSGLALSPDEKWLATISPDNKAHLWDTGKRALVRTIPLMQGGSFAVGFSADSRHVLCRVGSDVQAFEVVSGKKGGTYRGRKSTVTAISSSSTRNWIASGHEDGSITIYDGESGKVLRSLNEHTEEITSLCFSPNGRWLISGSRDRTIKVWRSNGESAFQTLTNRSSPVTSVAISADHRRIVSGSADHRVTVWDRINDKKLVILEEHTSAISSVHFVDHDNRIVTTSRDHSLRKWDAHHEFERLSLQKHNSAVRAMDCDHDRNRLVSATEFGVVQTWEMKTGARLAEYLGHTGTVNSVAWSRDGQHLAAAGRIDRDAAIIIWRTATRKQRLVIKEHLGTLWSVDFSPTEDLLAFGGSEKVIRVFNLRTGKQMKSLRGHTDAVRSVTFSADGRWIVSGSQDGSIRIWNVKTGRLERVISGHKDAVLSVALDSMGQRIVSGSADRTARIWDARKGELLQELQGHDDEVTSVAFSPDGSRVVSGSADESLKIWDARSGIELLTLIGHLDGTNCVAWSKTEVLSGGGGRFASDISGEVKVWSTKHLIE